MAYQYEISVPAAEKAVRFTSDVPLPGLQIGAELLLVDQHINLRNGRILIVEGIRTVLTVKDEKVFNTSIVIGCREEELKSHF